MSMSGPAPSRKAASSARMASSTCRSAFSSGKPALRPKPGTRVRADERGREPGDGRGNADAAEGLVVLAPAHEALVGADLEEVEVAPPSVGMQRFDRGDLHRLSLGRPSSEARAGRGRLPDGGSRRQAPGARVGRVLVALIAGLAVAACLGPVRELYPPRPGDATVTVHVVRLGW